VLGSTRVSHARADEAVSTTSLQPESSSEPGRAPRRRNLVGVFAIASLVYLWTALSNGNETAGYAGELDYNELTSGFLHGHLYLPIQPPSGLIALANPYNPALNGPYQGVNGAYHDLSYYHGHFFLSWGPTPVVTLYAPWRLLDLPQLHPPLATCLYGIVGLGFALALWSFLVSTYLPRVQLWKVTLGGIALATGSVVPFLLRRPDVYEVAVASGYCFAMASLYLLATGFLGGRLGMLRLACGSACAGLAVGGRPDLILLGIPVVFVTLGLIKRDRLRSWVDRLLCAAFVTGPFVCVVLLLLVYNYLRFNSLFEFGQRYALAGVDQSRESLLNLSLIGTGIGHYLFAPIRFSFAFPFVALTPSWPTPDGHPINLAGVQVELLGGVLLTMPILLLLFGAPWALRRFPQAELRHVVYVLGTTGGAIILSLALAIGTTMRYEVDFSTILLMAALLVWLVLSQHGTVGRPIAIVGAVLLVYLSFVGLAISVTGYYDWLRTGSPGTYNALEDATSGFPTILTMITGHPDVVRVIAANAPYPEDLGNAGTLDPGRNPFWILRQNDEVDIVAPTTRVYDLTMHVTASSGIADLSSVELVTHLNGVRHVFALPKNRTWSVPVRLERGLNRAFLAVSFKSTSPAVAGAPASYVTVGGLSLTPQG
jgi:hypothetical protein